MHSLLLDTSHLVTNLGHLRKEKLNGRHHIVAPVVMLLEGVHKGSDGGVYYPPDEIERSTSAWDGVPVTNGHPMVSGSPVSAKTDGVDSYHIGVLRNTRYEDGKLKGEAWVDIGRCKKEHKTVLNLLETPGAQIEVSTGLFTTGDSTSGTWNEEDYLESVSEFRPDHLAILPYTKGACRWEDGCGIRFNEEDDVDVSKMERSFVSRTIGRLLGVAGFGVGEEELTANELSLMDRWEKVSSTLENKLRAQENGVQQTGTPIGGEGSVVYFYTNEVFDDTVVYTRREKDGAEGMFRRSYSIDDKGDVFFSDDVVEVKKVTKYIPVNEDEGDDLTGNDCGCSPVLVAAKAAAKAFKVNHGSHNQKSHGRKGGSGGGLAGGVRGGWVLGKNMGNEELTKPMKQSKALKDLGWSPIGFGRIVPHQGAFRASVVGSDSNGKAKKLPLGKYSKLSQAKSAVSEFEKL